LSNWFAVLRTCADRLLTLYENVSFKKKKGAEEKRRKGTFNEKKAGERKGANDDWRKLSDVA